MYPGGQAQAQAQAQLPPQAAAAATAPPASTSSSSSSSTSCVIDNKTRDMGVQATSGPSSTSGTTASAVVTVSVSASPTVSAMSGINNAAVAAAAPNMSVSAAAAAHAAEVSGESDRDGGSRPTSTSPPTSPNLGAAVAPGAASAGSTTASAPTCSVALPSPVVPATAAAAAGPPTATAAAAVPSAIPAVSPPRPSEQPAAPTTTVAFTNTSISIPTSSTAAAAATEGATATSSDQPANSKSNKASGTTKKKKKKRQSTEFKMLESDSKEILGRIAARDSNMVSRRAFAYEPSLEIFREYSFSDYVRGALLGVEGVVDWESSDEEDEDDEDAEDGGDAGRKEEVKKQEGATAEAAADKMDAETDGTTSASTASSEKGTPEKDLSPTRKSARQAARKARGRKKSDPLPPEKPARISARIKARKEDEGVEDDGSADGVSDKKKCCNGDHHGKDAAANFDLFEDMPIPNEMLLADGIAKITPPKGWWDHAGIGGDLTGRGPIWSKGGRLGDMEVTTPIKQCASGIGGVYEYTMLELPPVPVHEFRDRADQYRKRQIREDHNDDTSDEYMDVLARKFWKRLGPTMEASVYGADMEGTLFDGADACGWNVDRLESALALLGVDMDEEGAAPGEPAGRLPGVTTAYLYYGMWGSTFAAHTEDMNLLSINYLHAGAPKFWYAIDPKDSKRFESLATSLFPAAARDCPEFLRHKRYLISPSILSKAGISYTTQVQRAGDAIITFPNSYHFGFNTGFNVAESTNFAVPEWLPYGKSADVCLCHPHSVRIDMDRFQELLGQYEMRSARLRQLQRKRLTYSEFARAEAARRRKEEARYVSDEDDEAEEEEPIRYGSIRPVEVVQMKTSSKTSAAIARRNKSKKSAASRKKAAQPRETWRRAKQAWPSSFREGAQVLCYVPAAAENYDEEGQPSEKCFSGTVIDACEGHVRVRFDGTQRKDDLWVKIDGRKVFLDDGPVNRDTDSEDESEPPKKKSAAKKKPASKKRKVN